MRKILLIIIDGLGDRPIHQLGNKTPLEAAKTPNLDFLAKNGICGLVLPFLYHTAIPTSEDTHFAQFGYDPRIYGMRRGIIEVMGIGMKIKKGDIALRGNFGTVDKNLNMTDRRAGRINKTQPLIKELNGIEIEGVKFFIGKGKEYRIGIIMRGKNLSDKISDGDPHYAKLGKKATKIIPLGKNPKAIRTANVLNKFLEKTHQVFGSHPLNKKREKLGLPSANYILVRGASSFLKKTPSFKEKYSLKACCVAGAGLYKGIGRILGMDEIKVKRANGLLNTNLRGKVSAAKKAIKKYDFVFCHIKATDTFAHDGNFLGKKEFIERIDKNLKPLLKLKNTLIVITADHSTCCSLKRHCSEPIPILIYPPKFCRAKLRQASGIKEFTRPSFAKQKLDGFSERACKKGKLGKIKQLELMLKILRLYKK